MTGNARHFEAVKASGHRYLLKPFRVERLLAVVSELGAQAHHGVPTAPRGGG